MLQITNGAVQARARVLVVAFLAQEEPYGRRTALKRFYLFQKLR